MNGLLVALSLVVLALAILLRKCIDRINSDYAAMTSLMEVVYKQEETLNNQHKIINELKNEGLHE